MVSHTVRISADTLSVPDPQDHNDPEGIVIHPNNSLD